MLRKTKKENTRHRPYWGFTHDCPLGLSSPCPFPQSSPVFPQKITPLGLEPRQREPKSLCCHYTTGYRTRRIVPRSWAKDNTDSGLGESAYNAATHEMFRLRSTDFFSYLFDTGTPETATFATMPEIQAFRGLRYNLARVGSLSNCIAPPYDVVDSQLQDHLYGLSRTTFCDLS